MLTPNAVSSEGEARNVHHTQHASEESDMRALPFLDKKT